MGEDQRRQAEDQEALRNYEQRENPYRLPQWLLRRQERKQPPYLSDTHPRLAALLFGLAMGAFGMLVGLIGGWGDWRGGLVLATVLTVMGGVYFYRETKPPDE